MLRFPHVQQRIRSLHASSRTPSIFQGSTGLEKLSDVDRYYQKIFLHATNKPGAQGRLVKAALVWVAFAQRPLKAAELQHALAISASLESSRAIDMKDIHTVEEIISLCDGLLHEADGGELLFWDPSFRDFLLEPHDEWYSDIDGMVATACVTLLQSESFSEGPCDTDEAFEARLEGFPLYHYAAKQWAQHVRRSRGPPTLEILSFMEVPGKVASAVQAMFVPKNQPSHQTPGYSQRVPKQFTGVHLAAYVGLEEIVDLLLARGVDSGKRDSECRTPLWRAAEGKHAKVIKLLTPLDRTTFEGMAAAGETDLAITIVHHAGQAVRDFRFRTAVHIAAVYGNVDLMNAATKSGIDINAHDGDGNTALHLALDEKQQTAVHVLLSYGARTDGIAFKSWMEAFGQNKDSILMLSSSKSTPTKMLILNLARYRHETNHSGESRRLLYVVSFSQL